MDKLAEVFKNACNNNIKLLNKSIKNMGQKHHAEYITKMMIADDININYQLLYKIQNAITYFYNVVNNNYLIKNTVQNILEKQNETQFVIKHSFNVLTEKEIFELVYQQAMKFYFKIDVTNGWDYSSYFDEAIKYRITSNFLQRDIEQILLKIYEDIEIVIEDTKNVDFLIKNYKKASLFDDKYHCILKLLEKSIQNVILYNSNFDEEYFTTVQNISFIIHKNFYGG